MEELRSFGYICPKCGKAQVHQRSRFALSAAAARMECECEKSALQVETDGTSFRLVVPCGVCGESHQAECSAESLLDGRGIGLACPKTRQLCCYIGEEKDVLREMKNLAIRVEKDKAETPEAFTDNVIMYEVLSELKDIAAAAASAAAAAARPILCRWAAAPWTSFAAGAAAGCGSAPPPMRIWTGCAAG